MNETYLDGDLANFFPQQTKDVIIFPSHGRKYTM